MAESAKIEPAALAAAARPDAAGVAGAEVAAAVLSILWVVMVGVLFMVQPSGSDNGDATRFVFVLMAIFLPVAMFWTAALALRSSRVMREESRRLQAAIDAMRKTYVADRQAGGAAPQSVEKKLDQIARSARQTEAALATFSTSRAAPPAKAPPPRPAPAQPAEDQPALAFGTRSEDLAPPLANADFIRALNFPESESDTAGFAALRRALKDRAARQLVQASQDMLTLLSQDGIYMDDLRPDLARPELWRRFAQGDRGRAVAALGGIRDRSSLALTAGRMREDMIFRDAAHHFLRLFDRSLTAFEGHATDEEIVALSETRTARAFMLLGRVTGIFD